jgi:hypothetical protein
MEPPLSRSGSMRAASLHIDDGIPSRLPSTPHATARLQRQPAFMRKAAVGTVVSRTGTGRRPIGLSFAAQLLGEVAVGMVAGPPGVLAYRSVVVTAAQHIETRLRPFDRSG